MSTQQLLTPEWPKFCELEVPSSRNVQQLAMLPLLKIGTRSNQNKPEDFVIRVISYFGGSFCYFASQRPSTNLALLKEFSEIFKKKKPKNNTAI